ALCRTTTAPAAGRMRNVIASQREQNGIGNALSVEAHAKFCSATRANQIPCVLLILAQSTIPRTGCRAPTIARERSSRGALGAYAIGQARRCPDGWLVG